jgi:hypothetical protein
MSNKMKIIIFIAVLSFSVAGHCYSSEPQVTIKPKWSDLNQAAKEECDGFPEDSLIITIKNGKDEITDEFCSGYGDADGKIIKDTRGDYFLLLKFRQGRGGEAIAEPEYLSVYRVAENLIEYVRIPIGGSAGWRSRWYYDYKINKPKQGGLIISLSREFGGFYVDEYPKEKKRIIQIK